MDHATDPGPPFSTLTLDHVVWRMEHVAGEAEVVGVDAGTRVTFAELALRARRCASALEASGATRGSEVVTLAWSSIDHLAVLLGAGLVGCVVDCVNPRLTAAQVGGILEQSKAHVVFVDPQVTDAADPVGAELATTVEQVARDHVQLVVLGIGPEEELGFERFLRRGVLPWDRRVLDESTPVAVFHTSGTTGDPRPVEVTQRALVLHALAQSTVDALGISRSDRVMPAAPLFHVAGWGIPMAALLTGASLVLPGRDLSAETLVDALLHERVTVAAAVPTIWVDVVDRLHGTCRVLPALREIVTGGSPVPRGLVERLRRTTTARVVSSWGMTETLACSTYERDDPAGSAGRPIPLVETEVVGPDGTTATHGDLRVRGPFVHTGGDGGWLETGDVVDTGPGGAVAVVDRSKDLVKSGGEWISSIAVESAFASHPDVVAVAVVAEPDPRWIERPAAYVVAAPGAEVVVDELCAHAARQVPRWWVPRTVHLIDALPLTPLGKVDKRVLRIHAANHTHPSPSEDPR